MSSNISTVLKSVERVKVNYSLIEKLVYSLVITARTRNFCPSFEGYTIKVLMD